MHHQSQDGRNDDDDNCDEQVDEHGWCGTPDRREISASFEVARRGDPA
jgi:hypothetical protein